MNRYLIPVKTVSYKASFLGGKIDVVTSEVGGVGRHGLERKERV